MTNQNPFQNYKELEEKVAILKKSGVDLSMEEDLSIAVMNLISLEEHFFFTASKTKKPEYFDMMHEVREMRKTLLARMIEKTEGESWCISKHLLATSMRLIEVGTKERASGKHKEAEETFALAYKAHNMFFALRLKIIDAPTAKDLMTEDKPMSVDDIMNKFVDCCKE